MVQEETHVIAFWSNTEWLIIFWRVTLLHVGKVGVRLMREDANRTGGGRSGDDRFIVVVFKAFDIVPHIFLANIVLQGAVDNASDWQNVGIWAAHQNGGLGIEAPQLCGSHGRMKPASERKIELYTGPAWLARLPPTPSSSTSSTMLTSRGVHRLSRRALNSAKRTNAFFSTAVAAPALARAASALSSSQRAALPRYAPASKSGLCSLFPLSCHGLS